MMNDPFKSMLNDESVGRFLCCFAKCGDSKEAK